MKVFLHFVMKEAKHILRDKRTMLILFGMPVVLMLLFGFAITNDVKNVRTVVVTSQMDHQTQQVVERLSATEYFDVTATVGTPQDAEALIRRQKADMAVVFSSDFASKKHGLQFIVDASDPNMSQQWIAYARQTNIKPLTPKTFSENEKTLTQLISFEVWIINSYFYVYSFVFFT